jgi:hypothetical protein
LNAFVAGLTGDQGLSNSLAQSQKGAESFGKAIAAVAGIISGFITFVREAIGLLVEFANQAIRVVNLIKPGADIGYIPNPSKTGGMLGQTPSVPSSNFTYGSGNPTVINNITVQSIDSEGAARSVAKVLNQSASRSVPQLYNNGIKGG